MSCRSAAGSLPEGDINQDRERDRQWGGVGRQGTLRELGVKEPMLSGYFQLSLFAPVSLLTTSSDACYLHFHSSWNSWYKIELGFVHRCL